MAKFKSKPIIRIIEAEQLVKGAPWPIGVQRWLDDKTNDMYVTTTQGQNVKVDYGEWIIAEPDGIHYYPCAPDVFADRYELIEE